MEETSEMANVLEKIQQEKAGMEKIKLEYETFKKNNPQDVIALSSEKLDELHKIEKKMNEAAKQASILLDSYAKAAISGLEKFLINKDDVIARSVKMELYDSTLNWFPMVQRFVYRCIERYGPNSDSKSEPTDKKRELMKIWLRNLFEKSRINANFTYDVTLWPPNKVEYGSIVLLQCQPSRAMGYYIFEINLNKNFNECVRMYSTPGIGGGYSEPVNIFNAEYLIPKS